VSNRNCINCGAPIEIETVKCPYCGTSYFDFTDIDLGAPVILRLKHKDSVILIKAACTSAEMSRTFCEPLYVLGRPNHTLGYKSSSEFELNLSFTGGSL
jgi:hypothetical protein